MMRMPQYVMRLRMNMMIMIVVVVVVVVMIKVNTLGTCQKLAGGRGM